MSPRDFAARVDANQPSIIAALEAAGYVVCDCSRAAFGVPDLFVLSKSKLWVGLEVKAPGGKLTKQERRMFDRVCPGPLYTVNDVETAIQIMEFYDRKGV